MKAEIKIRKKRLPALVRKYPGITLQEAASALGLDHRTVLRHARRITPVTVERGSKGRGHVTRLWVTADLPDHLIPPIKSARDESSASSIPGPQWVDLDEI